MSAKKTFSTLAKKTFSSAKKTFSTVLRPCLIQLKKKKIKKRKEN